jgi:hypothetical protein
MEKRTAFPTINGVEVERSYFEESNSMEHTFYYKNIPCPQLILDSPAAITIGWGHPLNNAHLTMPVIRAPQGWWLLTLTVLLPEDILGSRALRLK